MRAAVARRHRVLALAPDIEGKTQVALEQMGVATQRFPLEPAGASPFADKKSLAELTATLNEFKPHIMLSSGPKSAPIGALAAREAGAERVLLVVNGLRALELADGMGHGWLAQRTIRRRSRQSLAAADLVIFHNEPDRGVLADTGLLAPNKPTLVLPGSGIDTTHYAASPLPPISDGLVFLMHGRLDRSTGLETFCEAARLIKARAPMARFVLLAEARGRDAQSMTRESLARFKDAVEILEPLEDVRSVIGNAHVAVYPSHSEGMAGPVLEALSCGRPIVTSNIAGCREAVDERVNGCLVEPGNVESLAAALESFLKRPDLIPAMCRASRLKAERRFDERDVVNQLLEVAGIA